jgi:hypothetical protein
MSPFFTLGFCNLKLDVTVMGAFKDGVLVLGFKSLKTTHAIFEAHEISNGGTEGEEEQSKNNTARLWFHTR